MLELRDKLPADEFGERRGDGLGKLGSRHPVDPHGAARVFCAACSSTTAITPNDSGKRIASWSRLALNAEPRLAEGVMIAGGREKKEVAFKETMPPNLEREHAAAEKYWRPQRRARNVLYHEWPYLFLEARANRRDEIRIGARRVHPAEGRVRLAGRTRMDHVEPFKRERQRIALVELERVPRLWVDIDADHLKPRARIADRAAARAAEEVQQSGLRHPLRISHGRP